MTLDDYIEGIKTFLADYEEEKKLTKALEQIVLLEHGKDTLSTRDTISTMAREALGDKVCIDGDTLLSNLKRTLYFIITCEDETNALNAKNKMVQFAKLGLEKVN